jgi:O-antigen ligase
VVLNEKQALDRFLLRVVDFGLAGVIFVVPFLMGGRHAVGQLGLTVLAVAAAWGWAVRQCFRRDAQWRPTTAAPLLLMGLLLVVLQIVPLPPWLLGRLSPATGELLPLWSGSGGAVVRFGHWNRISFTPSETLGGLVIFLDFILLFLVAVQRIRQVEDVERLLRWCALSAVAMASFGIVQNLAGNGKFFWFYEHPFSDTCNGVNGSFANRNHFAQFMALGVGPLIWWLQDAMRRTRRRSGGYDLSVGLLGISLGVVLFAGLLSLSRGGIIAMFLAAAVCIALCLRTTSLRGGLIAALAGTGLLIAVSLAIFGYDSVSHRLEDVSSASLSRLDTRAARRTIWTNTATAASHHLLLGSGVGSFGEVYLKYADIPLRNGTEPTHAENGYLQVLLETGIVGFSLALTCIVVCGWRCVGGMRSSVSSRARACTAALAGSLAAFVAHALVDFVWYVPALMAIASLMAACVMRLGQLPGADEHGKGTGGKRRRESEFRIPSVSAVSVPRFAWPILAAAMTFLGVWMIGNRVGPAMAQPYWDEYLVALHAAEAQKSTEPVRALSDGKTQERWIASLENVIWWQPTHAQAHLKLVETHRRLFDILQNESANPMPVGQISDAVFNEPQFRSREVLENWLMQAVGPHCVHLEVCLDHARKALALCPLEGRGYVHVAELSFLWATDRAAERACVEQAMRVRPFDGAVLYAAGNQALLSGNERLWRDYLERAFRSGRQQQQRILADRVAAASPESLPVVVADILKEFQPDWENASFLHNICASHCSPEQLASLIQYRAKTAEVEAAAAEEVATAGRFWLQAHGLHRQLHDDVSAIRCARNALQCSAGDFSVHYALGQSLLGQSQFGEAELHFRWCLQRTPNDKNLAWLVREAVKGRFDQERRAAKEGETNVTR